MLFRSWVVKSSEPISYKQFAKGLTTKPNEDSVNDTEEIRIRYKYGLNPRLQNQPEIKNR